MMGSCVVLPSPPTRLLTDYLAGSRLDMVGPEGIIWKIISEVCLVFSDEK